jgi:hypothetical protein
MIRIAALFALAPLCRAQEVKAFVPSLTPVQRVEAVYPEPAKQDRTQGDIQLLLTVDSHGAVTKAEALTGPNALRPAAIDAAMKWIFRPVIREGAPVAAMTAQVIIVRHPPDPERTPSPALPASDPGEMHAAALRVNELRRQFPRTPAQILADYENEGLTGDALFNQLAAMAKAALKAGDLVKAQTYADQLLSMAPQNPKSWNYGNAIHDGNMVLGAVALQQGNTPAAETYLLAAGRTPGSPNLNSFGPNMTLAQALLQKNQRDVVLQYFALCREFWKLGGAKLDNWTATVKGGGMPEFRANLVY